MSLIYEEELLNLKFCLLSKQGYAENNYGP